MRWPFPLTWLAVMAALLTAIPAGAATLTVGPGKMFAKPCAAVAAASDGDTIEIDAAGSYDGDVCAIAKSGLTLRGVGGRPRIDAAGSNYGGKGIWVISGNDTTVENIEFSGATVPDKNGAGIRQEGKNLTVRRCYFHDNENGILSGGSAGTEILVEYSEFANNGFGDGFSHNMYIGHEGRFTLRYSYSHNAKVGHLVKSRAAENYILYNRLSGEGGTGSYEIDLPNAGTSYVIGNLIQQGAATQNSAVVTYGLEGAVPENPGRELFVVNNTFVNDRSAGSTFVSVGGAITTPVVITNNIFFGGGTISTQASAKQITNFTGDPKLVDRAGFDYRLLSGSPCINAGSDPGTGAGFALVPSKQYVHPAEAIDRSIEGTIDIGAYEVQTTVADAATPDAPLVDAARPDASLPDVATPDAPLVDAARPDASLPDVATPDASLPDASLPDVATPDASLPDANQPDAATPNPTGGASDSSGCSCQTVPRRGLSGAIAASFALMLTAVRRRGRAAGKVRSRSEGFHSP